MNIIFCGTPQFAVPTLERLITSGFDVRLVVTQPDRPRGRGLELTESPVKKCALRHSLPLTQPQTIKNNIEFRAQLESLQPRAVVVVGYGRIIPEWMLQLPPLGNINLHASLLPKYRGAAPIQWAIAGGEQVTGNTTIRLNSGLDTGDILLQEETAIKTNDTAVTLAPRLAESGADLVIETLRGLESGSLVPRPQDHSLATLAPILKKEDGRIAFERNAAEIGNRLRGFQPWPGAYTVFRGKRVEVLSARVSPDGPSLAIGEIAWWQNRLLAGCGQGTLLEFLELLPEGKKRLTARDFVNGYQPRPGERLGVTPTLSATDAE